MSSSFHHILSLLLLFVITYSQKYVLESTKLLNFNNAEARCLFDYGEHLASIHNDIDNIEAKNIALNNTVFIGMTAIAEEGVWVNIDGSSWDYGTNISGGVYPWSNIPDLEPNNNGSGEHCASFQVTGRWDDVDCNYGKTFLCNYPYKRSYLINDPPFTLRSPSFDHIIGIIDILDEIYIEFNIIIHSFSSNSSLSILHFGNTENERYPAMWLNGAENKLYSEFSLINSLNTTNVNTPTLSLSTLYHIKFEHTQNHRKITMNNIVLLDEYNIPSHSIIMNRNMYLGDKWNPAADVTINNLTIASSNTYRTINSSGYIYDCDAVNRFTAIRGNWVTNGTDQCWGFRQDLARDSGEKLWLGVNEPSSIDWTNYIVEVDINILTASPLWGEAGLLIRAQSVSSTQNGGNYYIISPKFLTQLVDVAIVDNTWSHIVNAPVNVSLNEWNTLRVNVQNDTFKIYWNDELIITSTNNTKYEHGSIGLYTFQSTARFKNLRVIFLSDNQLYTAQPTNSPTNIPSNPSKNPTESPTKGQTLNPTKTPTTIPTKNPTTSNLTLIPTEEQTTNYNQEGGVNQNGNTMIIIGVVIGVVAICVLILFIWCLTKKRSTKSKQNNKSSGIMMGIFNNALKQTGSEIVSSDIGSDFDGNLTNLAVVNEPGYQQKNEQMNSDLTLQSPQKTGEEDTNGIEAFLSDLDLDKYYDVFIEQGFDLKSLKLCQEKDLIDIGIRAKAHRLKILNAINNARNERYETAGNEHDMNSIYSDLNVGADEFVIEENEYNEHQNQNDGKQTVGNDKQNLEDDNIINDINGTFDTTGGVITMT